jgi:Histidine phosphatase superfamily (branch 1)
VSADGTAKTFSIPMNWMNCLKPESTPIMAAEIVFETHATSYDNEAQLSSGHNDVALSPLGVQQSRQLGERYKTADFAAVFCSDLQRS